MFIIICAHLEKRIISCIFIFIYSNPIYPFTFSLVECCLVPSPSHDHQSYKSTSSFGQKEIQKAAIDSLGKVTSKIWLARVLFAGDQLVQTLLMPIIWANGSKTNIFDKVYVVVYFKFSNGITRDICTMCITTISS